MTDATSTRVREPRPYTLMERRAIPPDTHMGRHPRRRSRWHILSDEIAQPICGRARADHTWLEDPYEFVPAGDLICNPCWGEFSWRPMPHDIEEQDRGYTSPCWIWLRGQDGQGYGRRHRGGGWKHAHREAYEAEHGEIPDGFVIHHHCEVTECLNPDHMEAMSRADHCRLHRPGDKRVYG